MRKNVLFLCSLIAIFGFLSCQIGLGEAVDTVAPTITIQNPPLDSIVRGNFLVGGVYEDDGTIESCSIVLESTDGTNLKYEYNADVDSESKTWKAVVDIKAKKVIDAPYQISVIMKDKGGHKSLQTRQFKVDNTPPVVVLQRPATKIQKDVVPDSYGQLFTLSGQAADDSNISSITINVYSDPEKTKLIHSVDLNNVPPTIDLDAAKFEEGIENDYSKIYGSNQKEGTKDFYCSIIAYDSAQYYPIDGSAQTEEDKKGNAIDYYYLYEDISTIILGDYKITDVYKMLSGKYALTDTSRNVESVIEEILQLLEKNKISGGSFSLNPANNPSFTVSGYETLKKDGTDFKSTTNQLSNKSNVVIEVSAGLDGIPLKADTLKVYVTPCDDKGNPLDNAKRYYPKESEKKQSGSSYKFVTKILNSNNENGEVFEVGVGKYYLLGVEGEDQKGNKVLPNGNGYGFEILPSGGPKLDTKFFVNNSQVSGNTIYISDKYNGENSKLTITGSVIVEDGDADVFFYIGDKKFDVTNFESTATYGERKFSKIITTADFPEPGISKDNLTFEIIATNGVETKQEKTIVYDCKKPVIELQDLSPIAYKYVDEDGTTDGKEYLNGENVVVKFRITDDESGVDGNKPAKLRIYQEGKEKEILVSELNGTLINTKEFNEGNVTFEVIAYDKAGNETIFSKEYIIDQSTDLPVILPDDAALRTFDYKTAEAVEVGSKNLYEREDTIRMKFIDDDGLGASGTYTVYGRDANGDYTVKNEEVSKTFNLALGTFSTTKDLGKLPKISGTYKVEVEILDKLGNSSSQYFFVRITPPEPTVTITIDNSVVTTNTTNVLNPKSSITATMNVDSEYKKYNIYRWFNEDEAGKTKIWDGTKGTNGESVSGNNVIRVSETTYKDIVTPNGSYTKVTYKFVGLDEGNTESKYGTANFNFAYDIDRPVVELIVTPTLGTFINDELVFSGKENDLYANSYLGFAQYTNSSELEDPNKFIKAEGSTIWDATVKKSEFEIFNSEGNKTVYVYAVDSIGNISEPLTATFNYDINVPKILNTSIAGTNNQNGIDYLKKGDTLEIFGKAYDTNELTKIEVQDIIGTEIKSKKQLNLSNLGAAKDENTAISWECSFDANQLENGSHTFKVYATDVVGRVTEDSKTIFVDKEIPVVGDIAVPSVIETESDEFTFSGKVSDEGGSLLSEVYLGFENDKSKCTTKVDGTNVWNKKISAIQFSTEGEKTVYVWAKDIAGNESELKSQTWKFDKSKPTITSLKVNGTEHKDDESFFIGNLFQFNIEAADTWGVKNVSIVETANNGVGVPVEGITKSNNVWISPELPTSNHRENGKPKTGTYKYEIVVTDNANKELPKVINVSIDVTAPTIKLDSPSMDSEISGKDSISGGSFTFRGTVTDEGVSGIDYYEYAFTTSATTPTKWEKVSLGGVQNWTIYRDLVDGTTPVEGKLNEGNHYLHLKAADKAGNISNSIYKKFCVDKADPTVSVKEDDSNDYSKTETNIVTEQDKGKVSFTVSDTHGLKSPAYTVVVKKDGIDLSSGENGYVIEESNGKYNVTIKGTAATDGLFEYSIKGTDTVGKETEVRVVIRKDTRGPDIKTTSPNFDANGNSSWITSPNVSIIGVCEDISGIAKVYYSFENTIPALPEEGTAALESWSNGWEALSGTTSWTIPVEGKADGNIILHIAAVDTNGKITVTTKTIKKDSVAPTLSETTLGTGIINVNGNSHPNGITLSGTYSDSTSGLEKITITDSLNQNNPWILSGLTGNNWSKNISLGNENGKLKDGDHTLTIVATDNAGNSTTVTRTLKIDTKAPSVNGFTVETTPSYSTNWFKQNNIAIKLTGVTDGENHGYSSGILAVEYTTDNTTWISMTKSATAGEYTATVNCTEQGANIISVRVKDTVGNEGTKNPQTVYIDTEIPKTPENWWVDDSEDYSGSKLVNGRNNVTVIVEVSDSGEQGKYSGIKSVSGYSQPATLENGKYKLVIPSNKLVNGKCSIDIIDNVGNKLTWIPFSFEVDNKAPEVKINAVTDADKETNGIQVNKTITLSGTAKDDRTLAQVDVCRYDGSSWKNIYSSTIDLYSFEVEEDTTKLTDKASYSYVVIVTDQAGNRNLDTISNGTVKDNTKVVDGKLIPSVVPSSIDEKNKLELNVLQDSDRPVIKFTNVSFGTQMSSTNKVGHQNSEITGTVSDDDGIPTSLKVKGITTSGNYEETKVNFNSTDGSFTISLDDGVYDLSFEVKDAEETTFKSDSALASKPKCIDKDSNRYGYDNNSAPIVNVKVDTRAPEVGTPEWSYDELSWDAGIGAKRFGGTKGKFYIRHFAKDDNGISSVKMQINGETKVFAKEPTSSRDGYEEWRSSEIDVTEWNSGEQKTYESTITVSDGIKETVSYLNITVDNKGPVVTVTQPTNRENLVGSIQFSGSIDSAGTIKYAVTQNGKNPTEYKDITRDQAAITWTINFDGKTDANDGNTHDFVLTDYLYKLGVTTEENLNNGTYETLTDLDLHFIATDDIGNVSTNKVDIQVNPQGDRPTVEIVYPAGNGASVGGQIRLNGSVADTIGKIPGIKAVYVQLTSSKNGTFTVPAEDAEPTVTITKNDLDLYKANGYSVKNIRTDEEWDGSGNASDYGIEAQVSNGTAWNLVINAKGEFNDSSVNNVGIKVFAKDYDGKLSTPAVSWTKFDSQAPLISQLRLVNSNGTIVNYTDDVCVKGAFTLKGNVKDQDGGSIKKFTINGNDVSLTGEDFEYPLDTDSGVGLLELILYAEDNTEPAASTQQVLRIKYDNVAPVLIGADDANYKISPEVIQSNGYYELRSQVKEDAVNSVSQSGLDFVSFYFMRRTSSELHIYDPLTKEENKIDVKGLSYDSGMYWKQVNYTSYSGNTITVGNTSNAKVGGLLKVGGQIYKIDSVAGNDVTLKTELPAGLAATGNVLFAKALVVDNTSSESANGTGKNEYGYPSSTNNDDGDGFVEGIGRTADTYEWYADIVSKNIPDGPIEVHYVAFDKAGNYSIGIVGNKTEAIYKGLTSNDATEYKSKINDTSVNVLYVDGTSSVMNGTSNVIKDSDYKAPAFVKNNAPRLAGVRVWTDYNGNGKEEDSESSIFYYAAKDVVIDGVAQRRAGDVASSLVVSGNGKDKEKNGTAFKVIKDKTKFYPNIVGGNGALYYKEKIGNNNWVNKNVSFANGQEQPDLDDYWQSEGYAQGNDLNAIEATLQGLDNSSNESPTWFEYEIHDSTEGTTLFEDSLYASMSIALNVQCNDTTLPNVDVERFFWKGSGDNSLYKNSRDNGHIELGELKKDPNVNGYKDADPKVSGQITVRGVAYDNIRLESLSFVFEGIVGTEQEFATYSNGSWTVETGHESTEALSNSLIWTASVKDLFIDERGHQVAWEINIDTNSYVGLNKQIKVFAKDLRESNGVSDSNNSGTPGDYDKATTVLGYNRPTYQVDVVPYITDVTTRLSNKITKNKSIYSRTAKGLYSIDGNEDVTFVGFNLGAGNSDITIDSTGEYNYMNGTIPAINNYNDNNASGSIAEDKALLEDKYNMQGNGITNDILTDDVSFLVWDIQTAVTETSRKVIEPIMKINPNGMIGFAYANGAQYFNMPNGSSNSTQIWQRNFANYTGIDFAYDDAGNTHSLSTGLDTEPSSGVAGRLQYIDNRFGGAGSNIYNWNNNRTVPLDAIAVPGNTYLNGVETGNEWTFDLERFASPSIAVAGSETTRVYIAYYDKFNNQIRFVSGTSAGRANSEPNVTDQLNNRSTEKGTIGSDTRSDGQDYNQHHGFESSDSNYSVVAGVEYVKEGNTFNKRDTLNKPGSYLDIAVIPGTSETDDVVLFVWFDGTNLNYTYRQGAKDDDTDALATGVEGKWSATQQIFTGGIGEYCAITVDKNEGIHIAAYDRTSSDLYYAYLSNKDATAKTCKVDSYSQVGTNIEIDVALSGSKAIPYISYTAEGMYGLPKVAYLEEGLSEETLTLSAGVDGMDMFTGAWEVAIIPTESLIRNDNVNIGVWKNAGERKLPEPPAQDAGNCYGNGKSYFVLGYATESGTNGYIETAQLK